MRRYIVILAVAALVIGVAAPALAQSEVSSGDTASFDAEFSDTDDACSFGNYTDTYIATTGEDEHGRYVDLDQMSTGDSGRLRLDEDGNPFIEPEISEEQWTVLAFIGEVLGGNYSYESSGCIETWRAELLLPPGFYQYLLDGQAASIPDTTTTAVDTTTTVIDTTTTVVDTTLVETTLETTAETEATAPPVTEGSAEAPSTTGDSGIDSLVLVLIAVLVLLFGWGFYWWFIQKPKRLYRFDRGDPGEFIPDDDDELEISDGFDLPTFGDLEDSDEVFLPPRGSDIPDEPPPPHRLCDDAHKHWRESVDRLDQLEQEADDRVGTKDAIADMRMDMIDQARTSIEVYKRNYDECVEAHLDDDPPEPPTVGGGGSGAPEPTEADPGGGEPEDGGGRDSPGIITPPPEPADPAPEKDCISGSSKVIIDREKTFTVPGGNITIRGAGNKSRFGGNGVSEEDLSDMDTGDLEEIFEGIEDMGAENKVTVTIPTTLLTVKCIRVMHCENGSWIETDRSRVVETAAGPNRLARWRSQEQRGSGREMTSQVKPIVAELKAAQAQADAFTCS